MMTERVFAGMQKVASIFGIGGISQGVAGDVVRRLADPDLSDAEFQALQDEVAGRGYELTAVR
ncbi:MAG: hypothetical protein ABIS03_13785 [Gemmatimonadaceae bacterium]